MIDTGHHVEAQQDKVGQVILGQRVRLQMGVNTAITGESPRRHTLGYNTGDEDLMMIAHHNAGDFTFAVDEQPDLATDIVGNANDIPCQLRRNKHGR